MSDIYLSFPAKHWQSTAIAGFTVGRTHAPQSWRPGRKRASEIFARFLNPLSSEADRYGKGMSTMLCRGSVS